jgi:YqaJ-like viral recombinase domain.
MYDDDLAYPIGDYKASDDYATWRRLSMSWRDRILHDGVDREQWLAARQTVLGASDFAKLAKPESVDKYLAEKLASATFTGNEYTEQGHRWEPMMLAWAGITPNVALIHSPGERGFAATPDGADEARGGECKVKHARVVDGPSLAEWRQLAGQFICVPEFEVIEFIWVELIDGEIRAGLHGEPKHLTVRRDHPMIVAATERVLPIATDLLARLRVALSYERTAA